MKNKTNRVLVMILVLGSVLSLVSLSAEGNQEGQAFRRGNSRGSGRSLQQANDARGRGTKQPVRRGEELSVLDVTEKQALSQSEKEGILLMREEEKLARDVYTYLYDLWKVPAFANIAESEQTHMESMGQLVERYELTDPVADNGYGVFTSPEMQKLYDDLTAAGSESLEKGLETGTMIEELDIADLEKLLRDTDNEDITIVYSNLVKGSRNHLRSFYGQLIRYNGDYTPVYLSKRQFDDIVSTPRERGPATL